MSDSPEHTPNSPWSDLVWFQSHAHLSNRELARTFGGSEFVYRKWRDRHELPVFADAPSGMNGPNKSKKDIVWFMSRAKTEQEIVNAGFSLDEARTIEGTDFFETRNVNSQLVYLLLPKVERVPLQAKTWSHRWAVDTDGSAQPYLMIQMANMASDKIKIVPLADVHFGSNSCMVDKFREYVNWIAERDDTFAIIVGDLLENSHGDSCKGVSVYEQEIRPASQVEQMRDILAPIAHKILWAIPGNHEDRSRIRDYDPLEYLCKMLEIPYSYEPVFADILWKGNVFSFHTQHGKAGGQTKGGKMNAAARPQEMQDFVMFTIMAHVHDGDVSRSTRICRDRVNFRLEFKNQYVIICPAFLGYFGSYASKAGYKPGSYGAINMDLFPNGDYHANS